MRQILVNLDGNTVKQMYLSDFDLRNTNDTKNQERNIMNNFIRYLKTFNEDKNKVKDTPLKAPISDNMVFLTPSSSKIKRSRNNNSFLSPPPSKIKKNMKF